MTYIDVVYIYAIVVKLFDYVSVAALYPLKRSKHYYFLFKNSITVPKSFMTIYNYHTFN